MIDKFEFAGLPYSARTWWTEYQRYFNSVKLDGNGLSLCGARTVSRR